MNADDGIYLIELPNRNWVAKHYYSRLSLKISDIVRRILAAPDSHFPRYASLESITQAYKEAARETEYGFYIFWSSHYNLYDEKALSSDQESPIKPQTDEFSFGQELKKLINMYSLEAQSGTPDFILARFIERQLWIFNESIKERASWRGESVAMLFGERGD